MNIMVDSEYKADDEKQSQAEHFKVDEWGDILISCGAKLKFELHRDNEVYQQNVTIREQILLQSDNISEQSISKHNKFCLDLFLAQKPTIDVENINF